MTNKQCLIGGNWKCNGTISQIESVCKALENAHVPAVSEVVIAVPALHITRVQGLLPSEISVASEDVGINGMGAYTGEHSAEMLLDAGVKWTLAGHSERRAGFGGAAGESSTMVAEKTVAALKAGMNVIFCIGEQLEDRQAGNTLQVLCAMLAPLLEKVKNDDWRRIVVAYEPVWAIGTGVVATPEQATETHAEIRQHIENHTSKAIAAALRIIYGGSVNGKNCTGLIKCDHIDGFLVGGASLKPEFADIIKCPEIEG